MSSKNYAKPRRNRLDSAIYGIADGEEDALASLYEMSSSAIYAYALTVTGNIYDAQDILQETFIKIYDASVNYVSQGKPMSWIMRIVRNLCYDKFRASSRTVNVSDEILDLQLSTTGADATDRLLIRSCLSELDGEERSIVVMHAIGGMKHRQIAEELGLPLNTVLSKYRRALGKLQKIIEGDKV